MAPLGTASALVAAKAGVRASGRAGPERGGHPGALRAGGGAGGRRKVRPGAVLALAAACSGGAGCAWPRTSRNANCPVDYPNMFGDVLGPSRKYPVGDRTLFVSGASVGRLAGERGEFPRVADEGALSAGLPPTTEIWWPSARRLRLAMRSVDNVGGRWPGDAWLALNESFTDEYYRPTPRGCELLGRRSSRSSAAYHWRRDRWVEFEPSRSEGRRLVGAFPRQGGGLLLASENADGRLRFETVGAPGGAPPPELSAAHERCEGRVDPEALQVLPSSDAFVLGRPCPQGHTMPADAFEHWSPRTGRRAYRLSIPVSRRRFHLRDSEGKPVTEEETVFYDELDARSPTEVYVRGHVTCPFGGNEEADLRRFWLRYDGRGWAFSHALWAASAGAYRCPRGAAGRGLPPAE